MEKEISFNILGSCVSRDIFRLNPDKQFVVKQYLSDYCPLYQHEPGLDIDKIFYDTLINQYTKKLSGFAKRCKYIDLTHTAINYLKAQKSDYLLLDFIFVQYDYFVTEDNKLFNYNEENLVDFLVEKNIINIKKRAKFFQIFSQDEIFNRLQIFLNKIMNIYNTSNIIVLSLKYSDVYLDSSKSNYQILTFNKDRIERNILDNKYISLIQNYAIKFLNENGNNCSVIEIPDIYLSDLKHTWGLHPAHYISEIYQYFYEAIKLIVNKKNEEVIQLKNKYNTLLICKFYDFFSKQIYNLNLEIKQCEKQYNRMFWKNKLKYIDLILKDNIVLNNFDHRYVWLNIKGYPTSIHYEFFTKNYEDIFCCIHCENIKLHDKYVEKFKKINELLGLSPKNSHELFNINILCNKNSILADMKKIIDKTIDIFNLS